MEQKLTRKKLLNCQILTTSDTKQLSNQALAAQLLHHIPKRTINWLSFEKNELGKLKLLTMILQQMETPYLASDI